MSVSNPPRRSLSARRGSASASDPFGVHAGSETARSAASRITIVRAPPASPEPQARQDARRYSWGSTHSNPSSPASTARAPPGRLSFAFSSFTPVNGPASPGRSGRAPSPGLQRSNSNHSMERMLPPGRQPTLTPQQLCELAASTISLKPSGTPGIDGTAPTPFLLLPEEHFLPFLDRPGEVTSLIQSHPTARLVALLEQTFPPYLRGKFDPANPPSEHHEDPAQWSFAELMQWLQTVDRDEADDREWTMKARTCVLARSELIWSRLKGALGVPPELEEDNDDEDDEEVERYGSEEEDALASSATMEPIMPGDSPVFIASPVSAPDHAFGYGGRDGGMEIIGEGPEEDTTASPSPKEKTPGDAPQEAIQGLRISTPMVALPSRSRPTSPNVPMRRSYSTASASGSEDGRVAADLGRVRRSQQQERGTGDPLFPSSFATLTMGPSLVANNPALRSGPSRAFRAGTQYSASRRHRLSGGWDTDGNDYAVSLGSGSERSFAGR